MPKVEVLFRSASLHSKGLQLLLFHIYQNFSFWVISIDNADIKMQLIIDDIDMEFLSDIDITTIVSNVLDNAIEAVSELPEEKRNILFIIKEKMNCLVIHAENPYKNIEQSKNRFLSTKNGHLGIGLKNIESVVNKYNGIFSVDISDENFVNLITIPYKK